MDYEVLYNDALKRAEGIIRYYKEHNRGGETSIEDLGIIFPELRESENERIRKALVDALIKNLGNGIEKYGTTLNAALAWLEKQGQTFIKKDVDDAYLKGVTDTKNEIEKQYKANYQIRKDIATFIFNYKGNIKDRAKWMDYLGIKVSFAEKQGNQKPTDKVEPKFHEGDILKHNKANIICKVISVNSGSYYVENIETSGRIELFNAEQNFHPWTIQDAMDGDVLVSQYNKPFIYNGNRDSFHVGAYCGITVTDKFNVATEKCHWTENVSIHPATKEQRDLLFQKMGEAGYEWDAEKKELKITDFSKHLKYDPDSPSITEQKPAWSEEDEEMLRSIMATCELAEQDRDSSPARHLLEMQLNWLKALKERITWKPSDEQLDALHDAAVYVDKSMFPYPKGILMKLYEQLKKLKA